MEGIADQLIKEEQFGFDDLNLNSNKSSKKVRKNKNANGVHKYMKTYLKMYDWKDREQLIKQYTDNKINPETKQPIVKMKQRYMFIQNDFDSFVKFLKQQTKKK